jgi:caa(3)-type oxidase subunit IV
MSNRDTYVEKQEIHISGTLYLIVGAFLILLTAMEVTVSYVHALRPVMVPLLIVLAIAKFSLIAMFFMHLRYEKWALNTMFLFPLTIAIAVFLSLFGLFVYLLHHLAFAPAFGLH